MPDVGSSSQSIDVEDLKKQVAILVEQQKLVEARMALDKITRTQETLLSQDVADAVKKKVIGEYELESEKAKLPFAELAGIKAGIAGLNLPTGKDGAISIASGTEGTQLLRSKKQMIILLETVADELRKLLPNGAVIVTESQLDQAYQAEFTEKIVKAQTAKLKDSLEKAEMRPAKFVAPIVAATYSVGLILDTINSLAKVFRVDRKIDVFAADKEAAQLLSYLIERDNRRFITNPGRFSKEASALADGMLILMNELLSKVIEADNLLAMLEKARSTGKKTAEENSLPASSLEIDIKTQVETAKTYLEGLDPVKKPEAFWNQVRGLLISRTIEGKDCLILEAKAQALQMTKSWFWGWLSSYIYTCGEVQVLYRILDKGGAVKNAGVLLKTSRMMKANFEKMSSLSFP